MEKQWPNRRQDDQKEKDPTESYDDDADPGWRCNVEEEDEVGVDGDFHGEKSSSHVAFFF